MGFSQFAVADWATGRAIPARPHFLALLGWGIILTWPARWTSDLWGEARSRFIELAADCQLGVARLLADRECFADFGSVISVQMPPHQALGPPAQPRES